MSNQKKLKLAFAMGGGVSLGTFSGAALSKAIIMALLYAEYDEAGTKKRYKKVVIDVFSGASAGSMALGIMLRTLANRTKEQEAVASSCIDVKYADRLRDLERELDPLEYKKLYKDVVAAQVICDIQYKIWVEEINIKGCLVLTTRIIQKKT